MGRLSSRAFTVALAVFVVGSAGMLAAGAIGSDAQPSPAVPATQAADTTAPDEMDAGGESTAMPADRLACTNGTSDAVVACGFNPGPTAVSLSAQDSFGSSVTVDAVELDAGGFVAVHRVSFVDGQFTESVVGVSEHLDGGLHRNVEVMLDESLAANESHHLLAIAYHDSDGDGMYDFVATNGTEDRPYTNTYSESAGNVTDEAGDVIGDDGSVSVMAAPTVVAGNGPATNADDDALLEDVDGDGDFNIFDALAYYNERDSDAIQNNPKLFDFDGDGESGTLFDAIALFNEA